MDPPYRTPPVASKNAQARPDEKHLPIGDFKMESVLWALGIAQWVCETVHAHAAAGTNDLGTFLELALVAGIRWWGKVLVSVQAIDNAAVVSAF